MEQLLALRLADLTRPIKVGIHSPIDKNILIIAAWKSGNIVLTEKEVQSLC
jgi:hypothetical protein|tara:strand:- start:3467 stop:3619 length:153 start_codon:yes stop_codon:yes gene_type:complete